MDKLDAIEKGKGIGNIEGLLTKVDSFDDSEKQIFADYLKGQDSIGPIIEESKKNQKTGLEQVSEKYKEELEKCENDVLEELARFKDIDGFDAERTKKVAIEALVSVLGNPDIPDNVKEKMLSDFDSAISEIKKADLEKIESLKSIRGAMSLGLNKEEKDGEYLEIIIGQVFTNAITEKASVISRCFLDETEILGKTEYHKETLDKLRTEVGELDGKYGLHIGDIIIERIENSPFMKIWDKMLSDFGVEQNRADYIKNKLGGWNYTVRGPIIVDIKGEKTDLAIIFQEYYDSFQTFQTGQKDMFANIKADILDEGEEWGEGKLENLVGMEKIDTGLDIENQFQEKVDNMSLADLVIILNQLAGIAPIYGGVQDVTTSYTGIEADGRLPGNFERIFLGVIGALDISVVGSGFAKLSKIGKIKKYTKLLDTAVDAFQREDILREISELKDTKVLSGLKEIIPNIEDDVKAIRINNKPKINPNKSGIDNNTNAKNVEDIGNNPDKLKIGDFPQKIIDRMNEDPKFRLEILQASLVDNINRMGLANKVSANDPIIIKSINIIQDILLDADISTDTILHILRTKDFWADKLGSSGMVSLPHVLESIKHADDIPNNTKISNMLQSRFGNVSQTEFFALITLHHDLVKNAIPMMGMQDFADIFKGNNLTTHQLDSAKLLRSSISEGKDSEVYLSIQKFLDGKGVDSSKTDDFINLMADVIEGHGGNTQFIQIDSISGLSRIQTTLVKEVELNPNFSLKEHKNHMINFVKDLNKKGSIDESMLKDIIGKINVAENPGEIIESTRLFLFSKYFKTNLDKDFAPDNINISLIKKIMRGFPVSVDQNYTIAAFLNNDKGIEQLESMVDFKLHSGQIFFQDLSNLFHVRNLEDSGAEAARFAFNIHDTIGYTDPSSESFIKLIGFAPIDQLMSSPIDSGLATLSELKFAFSQNNDIINGVEYEKIYNRGLNNINILTNAYRDLMKQPVPDNAPDYIKELGNTIGEAYKGACNTAKEIKDFEKTEMGIKIKGFFIETFKDLCRTL